MCRFGIHYSWMVNSTGAYATLKEAKRELYKKRLKFREWARGPRPTVTLLRDEPTVLSWRNSTGEVCTNYIVRIPQGCCCPPGRAYPDTLPYPYKRPEHTHCTEAA